LNLAQPFIKADEKIFRIHASAEKSAIGTYKVGRRSQALSLNSEVLIAHFFSLLSTLLESLLQFVGD